MLGRGIMAQASADIPTSKKKDHVQNYQQVEDLGYLKPATKRQIQDNLLGAGITGAGILVGRNIFNGIA